MNLERWDEIQALFDRAIELPPDARQAFVERECGGDTELMDAVLDLLAADPPSDFIAPPRSLRPGPPEEAFALGLSGRELGDFRLEREIGRGGMGVIYLATRSDGGAPVALKLLPPARAEGEGKERFEREVRAAAALEHPAIVPVLEFGESEGLAWYAMPFIDGHDLMVEIRRQKAVESGLPGGDLLLPPFANPLYVPTVAGRIADLADGLQVAHDAGVIHRDIKPQNVLLDQRGAAHLTDFGLAKDERFGTITASSAIQGTPYYMSPEQARALKLRVDHRTDVYSLSVVLFEALTLRRPFEGETPQEVMDQISRGAASEVRALNTRVPRDLSIICRTGISRDPADRYQTVGDMADDLRRFLRHEAIRATAPSVRQRALRWVRTNARSLIVAAALLAAIVIGAVVTQQRARSANAAALVARIDALILQEDWLDAATEVTVVRDELDRWPGSHRVAQGDLALVADRFERRLESLRADATERARTLIERGKGRGDTEPVVEPYLNPESPRDFQRGMALAGILAALFPDDPEIQRLASIESTYSQVEVTAIVVNEDGSTREPVAGEAVAWIAAIDCARDSIGEERRLGELPLAATPVPPGYYRVRVRVEGVGHADLMRVLEPAARPVPLHARVHQRDAVIRSMVRIDGGLLELPEERKVGCLCRHDSAEVKSFFIDPVELSNGRFLQYLEESGSEPPWIWTKLGHDGDWRSLPVEDFEEDWAERPITAVSVRDLQSCAEWYGCRLPRHVELELALRGVERDLRPVRSGEPLGLPAANVDGSPGAALSAMDLGAHYRRALANTLSVVDERCLQRGGTLIHAIGNVHEATCSLYVEESVGRLIVDPDARIGLGVDWTALSREHTPDTHFWMSASDSSISFHSGARLAF
ncbi:MAG: bifunctional serine/threonine-protein kinase/formylglycine-generating enzyme family protein [Planctomycetota bacterium]